MAENEELYPDTVEVSKAHAFKLLLRLFLSLGRYKWLILAGNVGVFLCVYADLQMIGGLRNMLKSPDLFGGPIWPLIAPVLFWAVVNRVTGAGQFWMSAFAANRAVMGLRSLFFARLQGLSKSFYDTHKAGWLVARCTGDMQIVADYMLFALMMVVIFFTGILGALLKIGSISWVLLAPCALTLPGIMIATLWYRRHMVRTQREARERNSQMVANLTENIRGVREVQAFSREDINLEQFNDLNRRTRDTELKAARLNALFLPGMDMAGVANTIIVIAFGTWLLQHPDSGWLKRPLDAADLAAYFLYMNMIIWPVRMIFELYSWTLRAITAAERIYGIIDLKPEVRDPQSPSRDGCFAGTGTPNVGATAPGALSSTREAPRLGDPRLQRGPGHGGKNPLRDTLLSGGGDVDKLQGLIDFEQVGFRYRPETPWILRHFDLAIPAGQTVALVGETGAGKTTVAGLIARFYDVNEGRILVDGTDVRAMKQESYHAHMGIVLQDGFLFSGSVMDNLRFRRPELSDEQVIADARRLGTHESIIQLPDGYRTEVHEGGRSVSEGQRQLIALTRALIAAPAILILDESTSALDSYTERKVQEALEQLIHNRTTLIIAHRLSTVRHAERILVIDKGRIVEDGNHEQLIALKGPYAQMVQTGLT